MPPKVASRSIQTSRRSLRTSALRGWKPMGCPSPIQPMWTGRQLTARDAMLVLDELTYYLRLAQYRPGGTGNLDVNGDGWVAPLDALLVINELNRERASNPPLGSPGAAHATAEAELPSSSESLRFGPARDVLDRSTAQRPTAVSPVSEAPFADVSPGGATSAVSLPGGYVRRVRSLAPLRAVGKHEGQLT